MSRLHSIKSELEKSFSSALWENTLEQMRESGGKKYVGPLLSFLPRGGVMRWRAARCLGVCVAVLADKDLEQARGVMRGLMWHMNEESGNTGWGIPESMGEILAQSAPLAGEFGRILFSYVMDTGRDDNYIDYAPLLCSCFWGAGRLARARPEYGVAAIPGFAQGLTHADARVRGQAALALGKLFSADAAIVFAMTLRAKNEIKRQLAPMREDNTACEDFDGKNAFYLTCGQAAHKALSFLQ